MNPTTRAILANLHKSCPGAVLVTPREIAAAYALKARERAQRAGLSCAVSAPALPEPAENPNQMHFAF